MRYAESATEAATRVLSLYGHLVDGAHWDRLGEVFAEDARFEIERFGVHCVGLAEVREFFAGYAHPIAHHVVNVVVTASGPPSGELSVISKFFAPLPDGTWSFGDYSSSLVDTGNGWRLRTHAITLRRRGWPAHE